MNRPGINRLAAETSPYLLQHANNPVHWWPWGEEALAEAKRTNRPILLSVGYAACHWCHVMAHESFESPEVAAVMNELFVNIKVDREERPDVDAIYMQALQVLGEPGGWPLTMFCTPAGEPFWGGTYFPYPARYGRPSFVDVLRGVSQAFHDKPDEVETNRAGLLQALQRKAGNKAVEFKGDGPPIPLELLDRIAQRIAEECDMEWGGLGQAPKFPSPYLFELLWRGWLRDRLPEPMIPAAVIPLPALPRLGNGKVDAQALPEPERAAAPAEEGTPRNDIERRLCEVFAAVLRRPQVGVHENFFDLGGDSIVSIQIVARARAGGIAVSTRQIFAHQTVAELAFVAEEADAAAEAAQGPAVGPVPLTPIQRRFLGLGHEDPQHYNQAMIFAAPAEGLRAALLEPALAAILAQHDALRLRLSGTGPDARQRFAPVEEAGSARGLVAVIDAAEDDAVAAEAARLQASLDPVHGPVTRLTLFRRPDGRPPLLHWVIHHLAVDGVSWRILLEDLATALGQLAAGRDAVSLPPRTLSFKAWAEALERHAASPELAAELPHWVAAGEMAGAAALPPVTGMAEEPDLVGDAGRVEAVLDAEDTAALLGPAHAAFGTQANDLLLCALARALRAETGCHAVRIDIEGHGREPPDERVDLSRTVGWFTSLAPLRLTLPEAGGWSAPDPGEDIRAVKEQLRRRPRGGGIGYGLLRYVSRAPALQDQPAAPVLFNYLGQFDGMAGGVVAGEAGIGAGPPRSPRQRRAYAVEVNALVLGGRLRLSIDYGTHRYRRATAEGWAAAILEELRLLLRHCLAAGAGAHTPSDFAMAGLDEQELARLAGLLGGGSGD